MSAFAIDYRADRVVIASDSLIYDRDEPVGIAAKVNIIPHLRAAILSRGVFAMKVATLGSLSISNNLLTLEEAAEALPKLLKKSSDEYEDFDQVHDFELMLTGWSAAEGRMRFFTYSSADKYQMRTYSDLRYGGPHPWPQVPDEYLPFPKASDRLEDQVIGILKGIDRYMATVPEQTSGTRLGGEILLTTISEAEFSQHVIGKFDSFDEMFGSGTPEPSRGSQSRADRRKAERLARKKTRKR